MNWKEFFRPTIGKVVFSVVVTVILFLVLFFLKNGVYCKMCIEVCEGWPSVVRSCDCCVTLSEFLTDLALALLFPFVVAYFTYSLVSLFKTKFKN